MPDKQQNSLGGTAPATPAPQGPQVKNPVKQAKLAKALRHNLQRRKQSKKASAANPPHGE